MSVELIFEFDRGPFGPGEDVAGVLAVSDCCTSRLDLSVAFIESTVDHVTLLYRSDTYSWEGDRFEPDISYPFAVPLPWDARPTYKSPRAALVWFLEAEIDGFALPWVLGEVLVGTRPHAPTARPDLPSTHCVTIPSEPVDVD